MSDPSHGPEEDGTERETPAQISNVDYAFAIEINGQIGGTGILRQRRYSASNPGAFDSFQMGDADRRIPGTGYIQRDDDVGSPFGPSVIASCASR